jgi:hypothetical protein
MIPIMKEFSPTKNRLRMQFGPILYAARGNTSKAYSIQVRIQTGKRRLLIGQSLKVSEVRCRQAVLPVHEMKMEKETMPDE